MRAYQTSLLPMNLARSAVLSGSPYNRGPGFGKQPFRPGFRGACGCSPTTGCGCGTSSGFSGFRQGTSLDQIIQNAANWLSGYAQSQLPPSAAVPPGAGSVGGIITTLQPYIPYLILGWIAYKVIK
jgi:hypothetical protein